MAALTGSPNHRPSEFAEGSELLVNNPIGTKNEYIKNISNQRRGENQRVRVYSTYRTSRAIDSWLWCSQWRRNEFQSSQESLYKARTEFKKDKVNISNTQTLTNTNPRHMHYQANKKWITQLFMTFCQENVDHTEDYHQQFIIYRLCTQKVHWQTDMLTGLLPEGIKKPIAVS